MHIYISGSNDITYDKVLYDQSPSSYLDQTANTEYGTYNYLQCYCAEILNQNSLLSGNTQEYTGDTGYTFFNINTGKEEDFCVAQSTGFFFFFYSQFR
jgi:hypothetical protein